MKAIPFEFGLWHTQVYNDFAKTNLPPPPAAPDDTDEVPLPDEDELPPPPDEEDTDDPYLPEIDDYRQAA